MITRRPDPSRCFLALCAAALLGAPVPATAQQIVISGVVVDSVARSPVVGAMVSLGTAPRVLTDANGAFRFSNQQAGTFQLTVDAVGYVAYSETITVSGDTTLTIRLSLRPILVDTLQVTSRLAKVNGWIIDQANGSAIINAMVTATGARQHRTKQSGRFEFNRIRTQIPFEMRILAFGYEPVYTSVVPLGDTTLNVQLRADTMIERLLANEVAKLEQRAVAVTGKAYAIDREQLLSEPEVSTLAEALGRIMMTAPISLSARGPTCYVVDEMRVHGDFFGNMVPGEVHRIEVFSDGRMNMVRIYTRRFMSNMITSNRELVRPSFSQTPRGLMGARTPVYIHCS